MLQQQPCLPLFSMAVCCMQEGGEHSLLHPCSVRCCHKAQGLCIWAMLHIASVGLRWAPKGLPVSPTKGKALLQPQRWGGKGLGLALCSEKHEVFAPSCQLELWGQAGHAGAGTAL